MHLGLVTLCLFGCLLVVAPTCAVLLHNPGALVMLAPSNWNHLPLEPWPSSSPLREDCHLFIHSFIHSCAHSFVCSVTMFIHSFMRLFVHSFIHLFRAPVCQRH